MAKTYRVGPAVRMSNALVAALLRRGVKVGSNTLLTVPGRKSGQPRTTPVTILEWNSKRWLQSPFGEVNWVRNLRRRPGHPDPRSARRADRCRRALPRRSCPGAQRHAGFVPASHQGLLRRHARLTSRGVRAGSATPSHVPRGRHALTHESEIRLVRHQTQDQFEARFAMILVMR